MCITKKSWPDCSKRLDGNAFRLLTHLGMLIAKVQLSYKTKGRTMRIAVTIMKNTERISPLFEAAELAVVVDCCRGQIVSETELSLQGDVAGKLDALQGAGVDTLLCGAIANDSMALAQQRNLRVFSFAAGAWRDVLTDWRSHQRLRECHLMPGCCQQHRRCCHQHARRQS